MTELVSVWKYCSAVLLFIHHHSGGVEPGLCQHCNLSVTQVVTAVCKIYKPQISPLSVMTVTTLYTNILGGAAARGDCCEKGSNAG